MPTYHPFKSVFDMIVISLPAIIGPSAFFILQITLVTGDASSTSVWTLDCYLGWGVLNCQLKEFSAYLFFNYSPAFNADAFADEWKRELYSESNSFGLIMFQYSKLTKRYLWNYGPKSFINHEYVALPKSQWCGIQPSSNVSSLM